MAYNWKNTWIWKYESIWCSLEKFKYANELTNSDIGRLLNASSCLKKNISIYSSLYIAKNRINQNSLSNLLEKDVFYNLNIYLRTFLGSLYNELDIEKYTIEKFRYCPKCIEQGYHSIFHQLNFFDKCVFHDIELKTQCPSCGLEYNYIIRYNGVDIGFSCKCGYNPLSNVSAEQVFNWWDDYVNFTHNKNIENIKIYNVKFIYSSFNYYTNKSIINENNYVVDNTDIYESFLNKEYLSICTFNPKFKNYKIPSIIDRENNIYDHLGNIMMNEYITILKSIARYIRKRFIKKYTVNDLFKNKIYSLVSLYDFFNIKKEDASTQYNEIDENLYAYILWRTEIEGHEDINSIHTPITHVSNVNTQHVIRQNISNTKLYKYIRSELMNYNYNYKMTKYAQFDDYGILVSSFERIVANALIQYFYDCLDFVKEIKSKSPTDLINLNISIPVHSNDFLIGYDSKTRLCYLNMYEKKRL